ncbi:MAG: type 1 glutamine amidotransferase, partial [Paludibacter sp.]
MKKLTLHTLMHVSYEGLGCIETWIRKNNHSVSYSKLYEGSKLPELEDFDWLIVMGGPMGVYDESNFPWLKAEKKLIRQAIDSDKTVIGICLGSQLIAEVLGTKVFSNNQKEIGWFDIQQVFENRNHPILKSFIPKFPVFHWHGDTFDLPTGSIRLFESEVCTNQAFIYQENVLGLQFHFEV